MFDGAFNMPKLMMVNSASFKNRYVASWNKNQNNEEFS